MSAPEDGAAAEAAAPTQAVREKPTSKVVRVLTVMAYLFSVSFAAILLSVYYICVWKSPELAQLNQRLMSARQGNHNEYSPEYAVNVPYNFSGRSDTTVNDNGNETETFNFTSYSSDIESTTEPTDASQAVTSPEAPQTEIDIETHAPNITTAT